MFCFTKSLPTLYIYPHYPQIIRSAFQRENPKNYTWEFEIVIPIIIYTFPYGFPQLLPLHLYILERLQAQTLTTPILSVKWDLVLLGSIERSHSFVNAIRLNCENRKAREDKALRSRIFLDYLAGKANPRRTRETFCFGKKLCLALPSLYPYYIYPHYPQIIRCAF